jgi:surfeit locus 1 family protein
VSELKIAPSSRAIPTEAQRWRTLLGAGATTAAALAALVGLGLWQLERKAWKESLIARIEARAHGNAGEIVPEARWPEWRADDDEFRHVRLAGRFLHDKEILVHGLMSGQRSAPMQGYYVFAPLRLRDGATVFVNRGFVPGELRDRAGRPEPQPAGEVTVTGLVRAPDARHWLAPENDAASDRWFSRDLAAMARARGLERVAPFWIDADPIPNATGWPRPGQTRLDLPNNHLQYALTWFSLALALAAVFFAWVWRQRSAA